MAPTPPLTKVARGQAPRRPFAGSAVALLASLLAAAPMAAQQPGGAPADTTPAPADTTEAAQDTARPEGRSFPVLAGGVDSVAAVEVHTWNREQLLQSSALTVGDFLSDQAPGLLRVSANVHFGPQQLLDGLLGPGDVRVIVDGRELPTLESAQVDLARLSLARVDRLRVVRRAGEVVVRVTSPSHPGGEAYSRITGGTGQPSADLIRGVFTNGAGRRFTVNAAVDHLNIGAEPGPGDRLDAWGKLSWMPFEGQSGLEVLWHSDALDRVVGEEEEDFTRSELLLHARAELAEGVQLDAWGGRTSRDPALTLAESVDGGVGGEPADSAGVDALDVAHADVGVTATRGPVAVEGNARLQDADGLATLETDLRAAVRLAERLSAHAAWHHGSWDEFGASTWSGGLTYRPDLLGGIALRAEASTGTRGLARPGRTADSVSFDAVTGSAEFGLGPYSFSGRASRRSLERRLPFGGSFDAALSPRPSTDVIGLEGSVRGPLIPVEAVEDRLRFEGFWRQNSAESGPLPLYVPDDLARGEFRLQDTFFEGNLEVRALLRLRRRGTMLTAMPGSAEPVLTPEENTIGTSVVLRVDTFRLWWRVDNVQRTEERDFVGLPFPTNRNVVGVKWEFFD